MNLVQHFHWLFYSVENHMPQSKEIGQAVSLIAMYGVDQARYIVDFSRRAAEDTHYRPQTFGGILQYTSRASAQFEQSRRDQARARIIHGRQALEAAYEQFKIEILDRFIAALPEGEYERRIVLCKEQLAESKDVFYERYRGRPMEGDIVKGHVRSELRKTLDVLPFDQFCQREGASILADYGIDPAEFDSLIPPPPAAAIAAVSIDS
jgi:hypothetical protein